MADSVRKKRVIQRPWLFEIPGWISFLKVTPDFCYDHNSELVEMNKRWYHSAEAQYANSKGTIMSTGHGDSAKLILNLDC
jgi:hypothetical protein